jgi:hypothetical protein
MMSEVSVFQLLGDFESLGIWESKTVEVYDSDFIICANTEKLVVEEIRVVTFFNEIRLSMSEVKIPVIVS